MSSRVGSSSIYAQASKERRRFDGSKRHRNLLLRTRNDLGLLAEEYDLGKRRLVGGPGDDSRLRFSNP